MRNPVIPTALLIASLLPATAFAMTSLRQVQVSGGSRVDLLFDGKVGKSQIRTEYFNDVIQLSLTDVSVYPAKISAVNGDALTKIFAYQYAPKLVRCRLTIKGKAEDYRDRLLVVASGRQLTVRILEAGQTVASRAAQTAGSPQTTSDELRTHSAQAVHAAPAADPEQNALLEHVMGSSPAHDEPRAKAAKAAPKEAPAASPDEDVGPTRTEGPRPLHQNANLSGAQLRLGGGQPFPSPLGVLGKLAAVLALFGAVALVLKRFSRGNTARISAEHQLSARLSARLEGGNGAAGAGWMGALGQIAARGLGRREKMVEVVSNHYLGPKKSIAVVRVMGRLLVLGVSSEAINLITQIEEGADPDDLDLTEIALQEGLGLVASAPKLPPKAPRQSSPSTGTGATAAGPAVFSDMVEAELRSDSRHKEAELRSDSRYNKDAEVRSSEPRGPAAPPPAGSVRSQIKSRLEGLKQL